MGSTNNNPRVFAAALKPINGRLTIYVDATSGSDDNSGLQSNVAFSTIAAAFDYLSDKYITDEGFVTIRLSVDTHIVNPELVISHAQGDRIRIVGEAPTEFTLKEVSQYSPNSSSIVPYGATDFSTGTGGLITMTVVSGVGFTSAHGLSGVAGNAFIVKNNTFENAGASGNLSVRGMFADDYPHNARQVACLGAFLATESGDPTAISMFLSGKTRRFVHLGENYPPGRNIYRHVLAGFDSGEQTVAQNETLIMDASPIGLYGTYGDVGVTADMAVAIGDTGSYLYNIPVPATSQITDQKIRVAYLQTIIKCGNSGNSIFRFENSGLHSISNVFFHGVSRDPWCPNLKNPKEALVFSQSTLGKEVVNTPSDAPSIGLDNVGFAFFTVGVHGTNNSTLDVGQAVASGCDVGFLAEKNSTIKGDGLVATYCDYASFMATDNSSMDIPNSITGIGGHSISTLLLSPQGISAGSYSVGDFLKQENGGGFQGFGRVVDWDRNSGILVLSRSHGLCEGAAPLETGYALRSATGGNTGSGTTGSILSASDSAVGCGFFAANNSHIKAANCFSAFHHFGNFVAVNGSFIQAYASASIAGWHAGFCAIQNSSIDATAAISGLSSFNYRSENNSLVNANAAVAINGFKHNFLAKNNSTVSAVGYESRIGAIAQLESHFFAANGSQVNNANPVFIESSKYLAGTTFSPNFIMPTTDYTKQYASLTY